jgi:hypothetical protein
VTSSVSSAARQLGGLRGRSPYARSKARVFRKSACYGPVRRHLLRRAWNHFGLRFDSSTCAGAGCFRGSNWCAIAHSLHQTIVIETVTGASGTIATGRVVHANPDGYTIGIGNWTSHVGSAAIYPLDYDVFKDLQPISLLAASPLWILGKNALPPSLSLG